MLHERPAINHLILCRISDCVFLKLKQPACDVIYVETCRLNVLVMFSNKDSCVEIYTECTCLFEWLLYQECWVLR